MAEQQGDDPNAGLPSEELARLAQLEKAAYDEDARRTRESIEGLLRFIDEDLALWILAVLAIVFLSALWDAFEVSDQVLVVLLSTTTANVLGLAVIVLKGMFGTPPPDHLAQHSPARSETPA
jgi:hypothetical protein